MKHYVAVFALSVVLLTGCSGTVAGIDTVEPVSGYYVNSSSSRIIPSIKEGTVVVQYCQTLLDSAISGDVKALYDSLTFTDKSFITLDDFKEWFSTSGIESGYSLSEQVTEKTKFVVCTCPNGSTYYLSSESKEDGTWSYNIRDITTKNFRVLCPKGLPIKLDGIDISAYRSDGMSGDVYTIPEIMSGSHEVVVSTVFSGDISIQLSSTVTDFDVSPYLVCEEPLRTQLIQTAGKTLTTLNKLVVAQDWDKFVTFFTPGLNTSDFSGAFYRGRSKSNTYDLKMVEIRDLELGDDVIFTGKNTVKITLGTKWTWAGEDQFKVEQDGSVSVKKYSEMRIRNVIELYYDDINSKWYVNYIDDNSLAGLVEGLEDWR